MYGNWVTKMRTHSKKRHVTKARLSRGHQQQRETCSDEVPTLHTSGLETLNSGKLALTTQLIKKTIFDPPPPPHQTCPFIKIKGYHRLDFLPCALTGTYWRKNTKDSIRLHLLAGPLMRIYGVCRLESSFIFLTAKQWRGWKISFERNVNIRPDFDNLGKGINSWVNTYPV